MFQVYSVNTKIWGRRGLDECRNDTSVLALINKALIDFYNSTLSTIREEALNWKSQEFAHPTDFPPQHQA